MTQYLTQDFLMVRYLQEIWFSKRVAICLTKEFQITNSPKANFTKCLLQILSAEI